MLCSDTVIDYTKSDINKLLIDAYGDLEPEDFIDMAGEIRRRLGKLMEEAQSEISGRVEAICQGRHIEQTKREYRAQLL